METVIAQPKKSLMASAIVFLILGVIFGIFAVSALLLSEEAFIGIILLVVGLVFLGAGIGWTVVFAKKPKAYITFGEGKFHFWNGIECSPSEVDYCNSSSWGLDGAIFNYGTLTISVRNTVYKLRFVKNLSNVVARINALKSECAAIEAAQRQIAEKNAKLAEAQPVEQVENKD